MIVLVLDPGTSTGYCLVDLHSNRADIFEYEYIDVDISSDYQGDHCIDLMRQLQTIIDEHSVKHIALEDFFFSKRFANGCNVNGAFRTAIHILARQNDIPYTILGITAWKTYVAGRSTPTKEQKKKWGATRAKKFFIQQALWDHWEFKFPNHSVSKKTKKPVKFRNDIIDVVAQAVYFCAIIKKIRSSKITLSVEPPKDVKLKLKSVVFEY